MCGLDCTKCEAFIATKTNDNKLREKTAKEWTKRYKVEPALKPEDIDCLGCLSREKPLYRHCFVCEVRKCGLEKGFKNCKECADYKCDKLVKN